MGIPTSPLPAPPSLPVRVRRTYDAEGACVTLMSVHCPSEEGRTLSLSICLTCTDCGGLSVGGEGQNTHLRCKRANGSTRARTLVSDAIRTNTLCVHGDLTATFILSLIVDHAASCIVVVNEEQRPLGLITQVELLAALRQSATEDAPPSGKFSQTTAKDLLTPVTHPISKTASLAEAAGIMANERLHHLVVVDQKGEVAGTLSSLDALAFFAREHGYPVLGHAAG